MKRNWDNLPALEVAMKTLEQIGSLSSRGRASVQARSAVIFIETLLEESKIGEQKIAAEIKAHVSRATGYSIAEIMSGDKHYGVCFARHIGMALVRTKTTLRSEMIAAIFGAKDHGTVLYGVKRIAERLTEKERAIFEGIKASLTI